MENPKVWYHRKIKNQKGYYTNVTAPFSKFEYINGGHTLPTPREVVEHLSDDKYENTDLIVHGLGYLEIYEGDKSKHPSVELPSGFYTYAREGYSSPERLVPTEMRSDTYLDVIGLAQEIKTDIDLFLKNESIYREDNIIYKLGFLMYGQPGNGKSSLLREVTNHLIKQNAIIISCSEIPTLGLLKTLNEEESGRVKVFIFEEMVTLFDKASPYDILNFLDGETSVDRSIVIATTNYPEKLPGNMVNRPGRFDKKYKLDNPTREERNKILSFFLKSTLTDEELNLGEGMSAATLKELTLLVRIKKLSFKDAVKYLKDLEKLAKSDFAKVTKIGL